MDAQSGPYPLYVKANDENVRKITPSRATPAKGLRAACQAGQQQWR
jgi:hypothetical protein